MDLLATLGQFHPLILHLPIGILLFLYFLEILGRFKKNNDYNKTITLGIGVSALLTVLTSVVGYLLFYSGEYEGSVVIQHLWLGVATSILSIIVWLVRIKKTSGSLYFSLFSILILGLILTGHKGGVLTHGAPKIMTSEEHLLESKPLDSLIIFADIIQPIFKSKCNSCHNVSKKKGGLDMTSIEGVRAGGENGSVLFAKNSNESSLFQNLLLPLEDDLHMPPKNKTQLTARETSLIKWWIDSSSSFTEHVDPSKTPNEIKDFLEASYLPQFAHKKKETTPASEESIQQLNKIAPLGITVSEDNSRIEIDLSNKKDLSKKLLNKFKKVKSQIKEINLAHSNVTDEMLSSLSSFSNLEKLQLQGTNIGSKGVLKLKGLKNLKSLNLYQSEVDDEIEKSILSLPSLSSLYLFETNVSQDAIERLKSDRPLMNIYTSEYQDVFSAAALSAPLIVTEKDLFTDSLEVSLVLNFKNVDIHYTLDGTVPDSTSPKYDQPFYIKETSVVQANSRKENWESSPTASKQLVRSKYSIDKIALSTPPSEKYRAQGAKTLIDLKKGTDEFRDGNWLGFEGKHVTATVDLGTVQKIKGVTVSALEATGSWIFYPKSVNIYSSLNGKDYSLHKESNYPAATSIQSAATKNFTEEFAPTKAQFVKIEIISPLKNPEWHPAPGGNSWIFLDEILIE